MSKHTYIISGESVKSSASSPFYATAEIITGARLSKDGRVSAFMPCLHWLANDIRGVNLTSLPVRLMPLPAAHGMSTMSYGGITQKKTAEPLYEPPKAEKINSPEKSWKIIGAGGDLNPRKSVWPTDGRADNATAVSFLSDKEKVL